MHLFLICLHILAKLYIIIHIYSVLLVNISIFLLPQSGEDDDGESDFDTFSVSDGSNSRSSRSKSKKSKSSKKKKKGKSKRAKTQIIQLNAHAIMNTLY